MLKHIPNVTTHTAFHLTSARGRKKTQNKQHYNLKRLSWRRPAQLSNLSKQLSTGASTATAIHNTSTREPRSGCSLSVLPLAQNHFPRRAARLRSAFQDYCHEKLGIQKLVLYKRTNHSNLLRCMFNSATATAATRAHLQNSSSLGYLSGRDSLTPDACHHCQTCSMALTWHLLHLGDVLAAQKLN